MRDFIHIPSQCDCDFEITTECGAAQANTLRSVDLDDAKPIRKKVEALAACRLTIGMQDHGKVITVDAKPIRKFEAWLHQGGSQQTLWPGVMELHPDFYETLASHAVPLDYRALSALRHSALAVDIYTWLAHRLCRINKPAHYYLKAVVDSGHSRSGGWPEHEVYRIAATCYLASHRAD